MSNCMRSENKSISPENTHITLNDSASLNESEIGSKSTQNQSFGQQTHREGRNNSSELAIFQQTTPNLYPNKNKSNYKRVHNRSVSMAYGTGEKKRSKLERLSNNHSIWSHRESKNLLLVNPSGELQKSSVINNFRRNINLMDTPAMIINNLQRKNRKIIKQEVKKTLYGGNSSRKGTATNTNVNMNINTNMNTNTNINTNTHMNTHTTMNIKGNTRNTTITNKKRRKLPVGCTLDSYYFLSEQKSGDYTGTELESRNSKYFGGNSLNSLGEPNIDYSALSSNNQISVQKSIYNIYIHLFHLENSQNDQVTLIFKPKDN